MKISLKKKEAIKLETLLLALSTYLKDEEYKEIRKKLTKAIIGTDFPEYRERIDFFKPL